MERRDFLKFVSGGIILMPALPHFLSSCSPRPLRFGMVTDAHYADREMHNNRFYRDSLAKMKDAVSKFNRSNLDFVIELGDLKDMGPDKDPKNALGFLDTVEKTLQGFRGPVYHVLGNHDMDCLSKQEFLSHTSNPGDANGRSWYAFTCKGIRCIVLDANFNPDYSDYDRGNFHWTSAWIPPVEMGWLEAELDASRGLPKIVFIHQMLDSFSDISPKLCVANAEEVVSLLERQPDILAVLQGHHHPGHYSRRQGIQYYTLGGMIEGPYPEHNSYAIVEVRPDGSIEIQGFGDTESVK